MAAPIPELAPVTSTIFPVRLVEPILWDGAGGCSASSADTGWSDTFYCTNVSSANFTVKKGFSASYADTDDCLTIYASSCCVLATSDEIFPANLAITNSLSTSYDGTSGYPASSTGAGDYSDSYVAHVTAQLSWKSSCSR